MSRFADPAASDRYVLPGGCQCQGKPHDEDFMMLRTQLSGVELAEFWTANPTEQLRALALSWNLIGDDGTVAPIDDDHLRRLFGDTWDTLADWIGVHVRVTAVPNASSAPSANGSRGSAVSHTRTTPRKR